VYGVDTADKYDGRISLELLPKVGAIRIMVHGRRGRKGHWTRGRLHSLLRRDASRSIVSLSPGQLGHRDFIRAASAKRRLSSSSELNLPAPTRRSGFAN